MKIGIISSYDSSDVRNWSGIAYFLTSALERNGATLDRIGSLANLTRAELLYSRVRRLVRGEKKTLGSRNPLLLSRYAREIERRARASDADVFMSISSRVVSKVGRLPKPLAIYTDATFQSLLGYYANFTGLSPSHVTECLGMERTGLTNADLIFYTNDWAARSAIQDFGVPAGKIHVVPTGANVANPPGPDQVAANIAARDLKTLKLLFVGAEWVRKGAEIAVQVCETLNREGVRCELNLVGAPPPATFTLPASCHYVGSLSKAVPEQNQRFVQLFNEATLFLLPTVAECAAVAYCEAQCFGVPVISTDTGGVATIVSHGKTGFLVADPRDVRGFVDAVKAATATDQTYRQLAHNARHEFDRRLNWDAAARTIIHHLDLLVRQSPARRN